MSNALEFVTRIAVEHALRMRQIEEACRPTAEVARALAAIERDMAESRVRWSGIMRMAERDALRLRQVAELCRPTEEMLRARVLIERATSESLARTAPVARMFDAVALLAPLAQPEEAPPALPELTGTAELEARVERLEELLLPAPQSDDDSDDGALHTGQYL